MASANCLFDQNEVIYYTIIIPVPMTWFLVNGFIDGFIWPLLHNKLKFSYLIFHIFYHCYFLSWALRLFYLSYVNSRG